MNLGNCPTNLLWQLLACLAIAAAAALAAPAAHAAVPGTLDIQGVLLAKGGGPGADGKYALTFSLYATQTAKIPLWTEISKAVYVTGGRFQHRLGSIVPLGADLLGKGEARWFGVQVDVDPELARVALSAVPFAGRAEFAQGAVHPASADTAKSATKATDLQCTGCVSVAEMLFDTGIDLGGNALKAKQISTGAMVAQSVTAGAFVGDGSKLTGIVMPKGQCKAGLVVAGIGPDGALICVSNTLPADGLAAVSNGVLTNLFEGAHAISKAVPIADNNPIGVSAQVTVPAGGIAQGLNVHVEVANSDISGLRLILYDPANAQHLLYDKGGSGKTLSATYPAPDKPVGGKLSDWLGKDPKGLWRLKALDLKAGPGGNDGSIKAFSVTVSWLSADKVAAKGAIVASAGVRNQLASKPPVTCSSATEGHTYFDKGKASLFVCDGADWRQLVALPLCGNKVVDSQEQCDDGNTKSGDGCTATCQNNVCGDGVLWQGKEQCDDGNSKDGDGCSAKCTVEGYASCKDVVAKGAKVDGVYKIDLGDGTPVFQAWCDIGNGGWMLMMSLTAKSAYTYNHKVWTNTDDSSGAVARLDVDADKVSRGFYKMKAAETRLCMHRKGDNKIVCGKFSHASKTGQALATGPVLASSYQTNNKLTATWKSVVPGSAWSANRWHRWGWSHGMAGCYGIRVGFSADNDGSDSRDSGIGMGLQAIGSGCGVVLSTGSGYFHYPGWNPKPNPNAAGLRGYVWMR